MSQGRLCGLFLCLFFASGVAQAQSCGGEAQAELALVRSSQDWREFNSQGKQLVLESGALVGPRVALQKVCDVWALGWDAQWLDGERAYDGQTNAGVPATSRARVASRAWGVELTYALSAIWGVTGRLEQQDTQRSVADTNTASGFTESFRWSQWLLGLTAKWRLGQGQLLVHALWGESWDAGMELQLAGKDLAYLRLGPVHSEQLRIGWVAPVAQSWEFSAHVSYQNTSLNQSAPVAVYQNGVPVAVAQQPRTEWRQIPLQLSLVKRF